MKKILFIAPLPPPVHGSAMVSQYIKDSRLVNEQLDCDFVNLSTSRRMDEIGKGGVKKLLRFVGAYFALLWKLLTRHYDLCYLAITCHDKGFLKDAPFVLLCKLFGRRVMIHQHNKGMSGCVDRWPYRWLLSWVYRNTTVMLLSWHLYPDIERVVRREQVVICPNGIPKVTINDERLTLNEDSHPEGNTKLSTLNAKQELSHTDCTENSGIAENTIQRELDTITQNTPCCARVGLPDGNSNPSTLNSKPEKEARLLFLSNLIPSKGVYVLLDACKMLKEWGLQFVCDFVGGETKEISRATFEAAVRERDLEDVVRYHGPKYGEEKERYWQKADVFVQPTYEDCFPLTIVEAMQHGKPVVSTDEGAVPDLVKDGVNGFVCPRQDAHALADALERLITDPALRRQMGEAGYARYKELYTLEAFERRFVKCLVAVNCDKTD